MIRWRFLLTRIIVIVAVLMLLRWGLGPVAKYVTIQSVGTATGAKVEISKTRVGLFPPRIYYGDVRIADPRAGKEMEDVIRIDSIDLSVDGDAILHRRLVVDSARLTGLHIGADRATSGHFEEQTIRQAEPAADSKSSVLKDLLSASGDRASEQARQLVGELETVRRSKEIRARWETEYQDVVARGRSLEQRVRQVRDQAPGIRNPLRDIEQLRQTVEDAKAARDELLAVQQALAEMPQRFQTDLASLEQAKRNDLARANRYVPGNLSDAGDVGLDMLADIVRSEIQKVRSYLEGGRAVADYTVVAPESTRQRGTNHMLDRVERPSLLIRRCEVGGVLRANGDVYAMTGMVENLTSTPTLLAEPTRTRLTLEGPQLLRVEYVQDRRQGSDVDLLTVHWPEMKAKPVHLGEDDAGLSIEGGFRELWVQLRTADDQQVQGRIVSKQSGVAMTLNVQPQFASTAMATSLRDSLAAVDRIELDARFEGHWDQLDLQVNSNLGQVLRLASRQAIQSQVRETREQLAAKIEQEYQKHANQLRIWLTSQQQETASLLAGADETIDQLNNKFLSEVGNADAYLGRLQGAIRGGLR